MDIPSSMKYNNVTSSTSAEVADQFIAFFESVYNSPNSNETKLFDEKSKFTVEICYTCCIPSILIDEHLITNQILKLPDNLVSGPDNIPNMFLKRCVSSISTPITLLLNKSFEDGVVLDL